MKQQSGRFIQKIEDSRGFTLIEAMISMAIFAVGILGVAAMQTTAVNNNTLADTVQGNTVVAMSELEEFLAADFTDRRINADGSGVGSPETTADGKYTYSWFVANESAIPGTKKIDITAQYVDKGITKTIQFKIIKPAIMEP